MDLVIGSIEYAQAIVVFGRGFFLLGMWMRGSFHRPS